MNPGMHNFLAQTGHKMACPYAPNENQQHVFDVPLGTFHTTKFKKNH